MCISPKVNYISPSQPFSLNITISLDPFNQKCQKGSHTYIKNTAYIKLTNITPTP
jgi:hypothetical protein